MATKTTKTTDAPAAETAGSVATRPAADKQTVTAIVCALLQSPRFASKSTDAPSQDLLVSVAVSIADKITAATA